MPRPRFEVVGCVVEDTERLCRWGIVVHGSHNGLVADNVVMGSAEACYATEDGSESRNVFRGSLALDSDGDGFWFNGLHANVVEGNVAAGCTRGAYWLPPHLDAHKTHTVPLPCECGPDCKCGPGGCSCKMETFADLTQTFDSFARNEAYSCKWGLYLDHVGGAAGDHEFADFAAWYCWGNDSEGKSPPAGNGIIHYDSGRVVYVRPVLIGCGLDHRETRGCLVIDPEIHGCWEAIRDVSASGRLRVEGGKLRNRVNVQVHISTTAKAGPLPAPGVPIKATEVVSTDIGPWPGCEVYWALVYYATGEHGEASRIPIILNKLWVEDCCGLAGEHRLYLHEQAAGVVVPCVEDIPPDPVALRAGCPERGLTNAEAWRVHGLAWAGAVAPDGAAPGEPHRVYALVGPGEGDEP